MAYASAYEDAADQTRRQEAAPQFSPHHHRGHALRGGPCDGRHGMWMLRPQQKDTLEHLAQPQSSSSTLNRDKAPTPKPQKSQEHQKAADDSPAAKASRAIATMSLDERAGQLIMAPMFAGGNPADLSALISTRPCRFRGAHRQLEQRHSRSPRPPLTRCKAVLRAQPADPSPPIRKAARCSISRAVDSTRCRPRWRRAR